MANSYNLYGLVQEQGPTNVFLRVDGTDPQELLLPLGHKWVVWGHTDTTVKPTAGRHRITLAAQDAEWGVTKGDALIPGHLGTGSRTAAQGRVRDLLGLLPHRR